MLTPSLAMPQAALRLHKMKTTFTMALLGGMASAMPLAAHAGAAFTLADRQQVQAVFEQQARAATAHDLDAFSAVFAPSGAEGDPVTFIARPYQFWGKAELIEHFRETFKGIWKFEPDLAKLRIVPLTPDVAQLYAPTRITLGRTAADARTAAYLVYEVAVRTPAGWRIGSIVPISAQ